MGRKTSSKGKDKKKQRKEDLARLKISLKLVEEANKVVDPMATLLPFKKYDRNGVALNIDCYHVKDMCTSDVEWAFQLTKKNMEAIYSSCEWGWNEAEKMAELKDEAARYLLARDKDGNPHAFIHFRFDMDGDVEVLYCYEVQLEECTRGKGLGKFLMQILEMIAHKTEMKKVVLTAFKHNPNAMRFFKEKLKYEIDETSPDPYEEEDPDFYEILSKSMVKRQQPQHHHQHVHNGYCCH